ncbi:MAG: TIGR00153 family protein [Gemmatimonadetes bacterium]|nr:TIGR00153 family protein [Gemmatimonadota bacterium]
MSPIKAIADLFGRSPFGPLVRHTRKVHETVAEVRPIIEAFLAEDHDEVARIYERISDLEHEADEIKREIRNHLPKSLFLPVDRGDMLKYLKEQDAIADAAEDIAVLLTIRRTRIPPQLHDDVLALTDKVISVSEQLVEAAQEMESLYEASFGGREAEKVVELVEQVNHGEYEADKVQTEVSRRVYALEEEIDPVSIYFIMKLFRVLGAIANHAENTGDSLRMMLTRK